MPHLEKFSEDQKELLVSLPYRVGMWVSESDQGGGSGSAHEETVALEGIITGYAEDFLKSEFVEDVMKQTLAHKARWGEWTNGLDAVPLECRRAVDILNERLESGHALSFRQSLMDIATTVAAAYCEFDDKGASSRRIGAYIRYYWAVFKAEMKKEQPPSLAHVLNISMAEREVLKDLAHSLGLDGGGNPVDKTAAAA